MSNEKQLDQSITDLRLQIGAMSAEDDRVGHLRSLTDDIETTLGSSGKIEASGNIGERVQASILQFEGTHPRIATVLNELVDKLSAMGI